MGMGIAQMHWVDAVKVLLTCRRCMESWRSRTGCLEWCSCGAADLA